MIKVGARLGRYELVEVLGRGATGWVYRARDSRLATEVCIKVLNKALMHDSEVRRRFEGEVLLARRVNHPAIARVFDLGEADDEDAPVLYLVMELITGRTLGRRLESEVLSPQAAVCLTRQVCHGVAALHAGGVLHRDIKPTNLMVQDSGEVKLLDFGIAKQLDSGPSDVQTAPGVTLGSAPFLAPELWEGREASVATDVWSIGVVLYAALTGRLPFRGANWVEILDAIRGDPPPLPSTISKCPPALDDVVQRALSRDVTTRFASALALDEALAPHSPPMLQPGTAFQLTPAFLDAARLDTEVTSPRHQPTMVLPRRSGPSVPSPAPAPTSPPSRGGPSRSAVFALLLSTAAAMVAVVATVFVVLDDPPPPRPPASSTPSPPPDTARAPAPPPEPNEPDQAAPDEPPPPTPTPKAERDPPTPTDEVAPRPPPPTPRRAERSRGRSMDPARRRYQEQRAAVGRSVAKLGLRPGDVPELDRLRTSMSRSAKAKRWPAAAGEAKRAAELLEDLEIDKAFVMRKLSRFNRRYDRVEDPATKQQLVELSGRIGAALSGEQYDEANRLLNEGFVKSK